MEGTEGWMEVWGFCAAAEILGDFPNCPDPLKKKK